GGLAGVLLLIALRPVFAQPLFQSDNYRDKTVPVGVGVVLPMAVLAVGAAWAIAAVGGDVAFATWPAAVVAAAGFRPLGLLDDLAGRGEARGFRGHVAALAHGRLTTGGVKLAGGAAVALVACAPFETSALRLILDAALVALAANLANLFDRAPGRVIKV